MGVLDGQAVNQTVTNAAFINKNQDDAMPGILALTNTDPDSGPTIDNTQRVQNRLMDATGVAENPDADNGMKYSDTAPNERVVDDEDHEISIAKLDSAFNDTTGHKHTGVPGDGPPIQSKALADVPFVAYPEQGGDFTTAGSPSTSTDVSALLAGKSPSTPDGLGVVVTAPNNRVVIRQGAAAPQENEAYTDGAGNIVYGRLTFAASVWTLSYYSLVGNVETPYSFAASSRIRWYYTEIYNPMDSDAPPPIYSPLFQMFDDNKSTGSGSSGDSCGLDWNEYGGNAPIAGQFDNQNVYNFEPGLGQTLNALVKVPQTYTPGDPISLALGAFSPSTTNSFLLQTLTTLIREGTDAFNSTTNQHTSTNAAQANGSPSNVLREIIVDLTDGSGMVNGVAVSPGDILKVALSRDAGDSDTADVSFPPVSTELRFS